MSLIELLRHCLSGDEASNTCAVHTIVHGANEKNTFFSLNKFICLTSSFTLHFLMLLLVIVLWFIVILFHIFIVLVSVDEVKRAENKMQNNLRRLICNSNEPQQRRCWWRRTHFHREIILANVSQRRFCCHFFCIQNERKCIWLIRPNSQKTMRRQLWRMFKSTIPTKQRVCKNFVAFSMCRRSRITFWIMKKIHEFDVTTLEVPTTSTMQLHYF